MKLHSTPPSTLHMITGCGPDYLEVNKVRYTHPLCILPKGPILSLPPFALPPSDNTDALDAEHTDALQQALKNNDIEILLVGSPYSIAQLYTPLMHCIQSTGKPYIGLEIMDFHSACGTYNILAADHKKVAAALWF